MNLGMDASKRSACLSVRSACFGGEAVSIAPPIFIAGIHAFHPAGQPAVVQLFSRNNCQKPIRLVRWPDMDVWTRRMLYRDVTLSRSDFFKPNLLMDKKLVEAKDFLVTFSSLKK